MNIDNINKIITIEPEDIYSEKITNITRVNDKPFWDLHGKFISFVHYNDGYPIFDILGEFENFYEYKLNVNIKHVILYNDDTFKLCDKQTYLMKNLHNFTHINFGCLNPEKSVAELANKLNLKNINMAEIGIRYCSTATYNIRNIDSIIKYDLYEIQHMFCEHARNIFKNDNRINVFEGPANISLKKLDKNIIYNFIFYDCTHHYETDKIIVKEMINHINNNTVVCFHDYNISEVKQLVHEFANLNLCEVYAINKHKIIKILSDNIQ